MNALIALFKTIVVHHLALVHMLVTEYAILLRALALHVRWVQILQHFVVVEVVFLLGYAHIGHRNPLELHIREPGDSHAHHAALD